MNIVSLEIAEPIENIPVVDLPGKKGRGILNVSINNKSIRERTIDEAVKEVSNTKHAFQFQKIVSPKLLNPILSLLTEHDSIFHLIPQKAISKMTKQMKWEDIIYGKYVYGRESGVLYNVDEIKDEIFDSNKYAIGAEAVEILIGTIDSNVINSLLRKQCKDAKTVEEMEREGLIPTGQYDDTNTVLIGNEMYPYIGDNIPAIDKFCKSDSYLLSLMYGSPEDLYRAIQNEWYVLPRRVRPGAEVAEDGLTTEYKQFISLISRYNITVMASSKVKVVSEFYCELQKQLNKIFRGKETENFKSLEVRLKSKYGLIRSDMIGCRADYTARSVITLDSELPTGWVGVPKSIAIKIFEDTLLKEYCSGGNISPQEYLNSRTFEELYQDVEIMNGATVLIGRQPTLFYLGVQTRRIVLVDGNAIVMSPLDITAFGADFDGDTMHLTAFQNIRRIAGADGYITEECRGFCDTCYKWVTDDDSDLVFNGKIKYVYPKDGKPSLELKMDIVYGITTSLKQSNIIYNEGDRDNSTYNVNPYDNFDYAREAIRRISINILSPYTVVNGKNYTIAQAIVARGLMLDESIIPSIIYNTEKNCIQYQENDKVDLSGEAFKIFDKYNERQYLECLDLLKDFGFAVAKVFPPSIEVVSQREIEQLNPGYFDAVNNVRESIFKNKGSALFTEGDQSIFKMAYSSMEETDKQLKNKKINNGWTDIIRCGARGKPENMQQSLLTKGIINNCSENIKDNLILSNYSKGLSAMEGFIVANGSRADLIAKNISAAEPGYLSRQLQYSCSGIIMNGDDCGTQETLNINLQNIVKTQNHLERNTSSTGVEYIKEDELRKFIKTNFVGRNIKYNDRVLMITNNNIDIVLTELKAGRDIHLFSPIFCNNRCCRKCYGEDLRHVSDLHDGVRIGMIAAQAVSEPSTQLTMKLFQSGGVARDEDLSSDIVILQGLLNGSLKRFSIQDKKAVLATADNEEFNDTDKITLHDHALLTLLKATNVLWSNAGKVNIKNIETVISSCIRFVEMQSPEVAKVRKDRNGMIPIFFGLKRGILRSGNVMNRLGFENVAKGIATSTLFNSIKYHLNETSLAEAEMFGVFDYIGE